MSSLRSSSMLLRNVTSARAASTAPRWVRTASTGAGGDKGESQPPRTQAQPATKQGEAKTMLPIAGAGLALGAVFFYLMSKPADGPAVAHKTGQNLPELTSRNVVDEKAGTRMGTHREGGKVPEAKSAS